MRPPKKKTNWDKRFMDLSKMVATWSKDKSTGVGAVIVNDEKKIVSVGYNGFPRKINDDIACRHESPEKHHWTIHAERSAILEADISLKEATLYCTFFTCSICAQEITQKGIKRVVAPEPDWDHPRYGEGQKIAMEMYKEAGVEVDFYEDKSKTNHWVFYKIKCGGGEIHAVVTHDNFERYIKYYVKNLEEDGVDVKSWAIDKEWTVVKIFVGKEETKYLYFKKHEVNDFIFKRN